jgi:predicted nucleic acid-binding protein
MICYDTSFMLDLLGRGGRKSQESAAEKLEQLEYHGVGSTTRFNVAELYVGIELAANGDAERTAIEYALSGIRILEFDASAAEMFAHLYARLRRGGVLPGMLDLLIAAVAVANSHEIVTRNVRHFARIPELVVHAY